MRSRRGSRRHASFSCGRGTDRELPKITEHLCASAGTPRWANVAISARGPAVPPASLDLGLGYFALGALRTGRERRGGPLELRNWAGVAVGRSASPLTRLGQGSRATRASGRRSRPGPSTRVATIRTSASRRPRERERRLGLANEIGIHDSALVGLGEPGRRGRGAASLLGGTAASDGVQQKLKPGVCRVVRPRQRKRLAQGGTDQVVHGSSGLDRAIGRAARDRRRRGGPRVHVQAPCSRGSRTKPLGGSIGSVQ